MKRWKKWRYEYTYIYRYYIICWYMPIHVRNIGMHIMVRKIEMIQPWNCWCISLSESINVDNTIIQKGVRLVNHAWRTQRVSWISSVMKLFGLHIRTKKSFPYIHLCGFTRQCNYIRETQTHLLLCSIYIYHVKICWSCNILLPCKMLKPSNYLPFIALQSVPCHSVPVNQIPSHSNVTQTNEPRPLMRKNQ